MPEKETYLQEIPEGKIPGWRIIDPEGKQLNLPYLTIKNDRMGVVLTYGFNPEGGYDQITLEETGGGGSVIVVYTIDGEGNLLVGGVTQPRPLQSVLSQWNLPRGFLDPNKAHFQVAQEELAEETGLTSVSIKELSGMPMNPNSAFFVTRGENSDQTPKGVKFFAVQIPFEDTLVDENTDLRMINPKKLIPTEGDKIAEKMISGITFRPWAEAVMVGDMFTAAGTVRLLADREQQRK